MSNLLLLLLTSLLAVYCHRPNRNMVANMNRHLDNGINPIEFAFDSMMGGFDNQPFFHLNNLLINNNFFLNFFNGMPMQLNAQNGLSKINNEKKSVELKNLEKALANNDRLFENYTEDRKSNTNEINKIHSKIAEIENDFTEISSLVESKKGSKKLSSDLYNYAQKLKNEKVELKNRLDLLKRQIEKDNLNMQKIKDLKIKIEEKINRIGDGNFLANKHDEPKETKKKEYNSRSAKYWPDEEIDKLFQNLDYM